MIIGEKTKTKYDGYVYFFHSDCGRVLDCAHDDECSFKLTSVEARRSVFDDTQCACAEQWKEQQKKKNISRREYRHHIVPLYAACVRPHLCLIIILRGNTSTIFRLCATTGSYERIAGETLQPPESDHIGSRVVFRRIACLW